MSNAISYATVDSALNAFVFICVGAAIVLVVGYAVSEWKRRK